MTFALSMARRDARGAWRHFLYFFVSIALGVGALVGIGLFAASVERTVTREARSLLGGDVEIRLSRPISQDGAAALDTLAGRGLARAHVSELSAMAAVPGGRTSQIVELKAVDAAYPLYGQVRTEPAAPLAALLQRDADGAHGAVVQDALLIKLGAAVGDRLTIGEAVYRITGRLRQEPDRVATAFSLGPRVLISRDALADAALIRPGSRVRERYLLRLPPDMPAMPLVYELRGTLARDSARVVGYQDAQPQLRRFLEQLTRYLGLIGLTALLIGGLGIATSIHAFVKDKWQTIAILKTLGADSALLIRIYLAQALGLAALAGIAGIALGVLLQSLLPHLFAAFVPIDLTRQAKGSAVIPIVKAVSVGLLTALLFALWPLLAVRDIRPAAILRGEAHARRWWADPLRTAILVVIAGALTGLAMLQARSLMIGGLFMAGLSAAVIILWAAAWALVRLIPAQHRARSVTTRYAIGNLRRPGSQALGVILSVGLGVMIIVTVSLLERSLVDEIGESRPVSSPTFFFIDIQPDQAEPFRSVVRTTLPQREVELTPLIRSRLYSVNGARVTAEDAATDVRTAERSEPERERSWYFTREYVLTFLETLPKNNRVIEGAWWMPGTRSPQPLVSVEEEAARHLGVSVGSTIEFDILGVPVSARVASIRSVEWSNFSTNFYMILSPGSLDGVPYTYVATVRVTSAEEMPLQQAVMAALPNVTAINIGEVMESFSRILEQLSLAIRAVALFCILPGAVVMGAALATTRYRRLYESVILKALGATRGVIARAFAVEYAIMGAVAGCIGAMLGSALAWAVLYYVFNLPWRVHPEVLAAGLAATILLTLVVGFFSTFRLLRRKPLAILRYE